MSYIFRLFESAYRITKSTGILGLWFKEWEDNITAQRILGGVLIVVPFVFIIFCLIAIGINMLS